MELININKHSVSVGASHLTTYIELLIKSFESGKIRTDKGNKYSPSTIRHYKNLLDWWNKFEGGNRTELSQVNLQQCEAFSLFISEGGLALNSCATILKKLKAVLKRAYLNGFATYNGDGIKTPTEQTTQIYLSVEELNKIAESNTLTNGERKIFDAFIIGCFTSLRYDTLAKFLKSPISYIKESGGHSYIEIISDKTGVESVIPLGNNVIEVLERNGGSIEIHPTDESYFNRTIKTIGEKAGLDNVVVERITRNGVTEERFIPKYKLLRSHSGRRTFISLAKMTDISDREICAITGHTSEKQMQNYSRITNLQKVKGVLGHELFDTKIG